MGSGGGGGQEAPGPARPHRTCQVLGRVLVHVLGQVLGRFLGQVLVRVLVLGWIPELTELSLWQSPPIEALIYSKEIFIPHVIVMLISQPDPRPGLGADSQS